MRIAHLTTVHPRVDARIRIKEVGSLAKAFVEPVGLFVQDGKGDSIEADGMIRIIDIGTPPKGRLIRMSLGIWRMSRAVFALKPKIVHFHDPELIPLGFIFRCCGFKVIYDVHEDVPRDILTKFWLPVVTRRPVSLVLSAIEWLAGQGFHAIVPAEPHIATRFPPQKTVLVQNYPILNELVELEPPNYRQRPPHFVYIGAISSTRSVREMVESLKYTENEDIMLQLAGKFGSPGLKQQIEALASWKQVQFSGWVNRRQAAKILNNVRAGLVILSPTPRLLTVYPTKMFEYMSVGLPVIASDFTVCRRIIESLGCGLLVDPRDPKAIADAMLWILNNPEEAEMMGRRGRKAVEESYNWEQEGNKLINLYRKLLSGQME